MERFQECEPSASAAILAALTQDTAAEVRCAAAQALLVDINSKDGLLPTLISRATRDTSATVRSAALTQLRNAVPWASLNSQQRRDLAGWVSCAASPVERLSGTLLIATWLWSCSWDVLTFLEGFEVVEAFGEDEWDDAEALSSLPCSPAISAETSAMAALKLLFLFSEQSKPSASTGNAFHSQFQDAEDNATAQSLSRAPSALELWEGVKSTLASTVPNPNEISPEAALYIRTRSSWLYSGTTAFPEDVRCAAVEALNPDAPTLFGVLGAVASALGCIPYTHGFGVEDMSIGDASTFAPNSPVPPINNDDQRLRALAKSAGVPTPGYLGGIPSLPSKADPAALAALHSLLHTASFVDVPEGVARNGAVGCLIAILPHPCIPSWAVPLLIDRLAGALGCGNNPFDESNRNIATGADNPPLDSSTAEAYTLFTTLLLALVGSLREGVDVAMSRVSSVGEAGGAQGVDIAETLHQELEAAQDELEVARESGAPGDVAAARKNVAALEARLTEAEKCRNIGVPAAPLMLEEGHVLLSPSDLAGGLWLRALQITSCILSGTPGLRGGCTLLRTLLPVILSTVNPSRALLRPPPLGLQLPESGLAGARLLTSLIVPSITHPFPLIKREAVRAATLLALCQGSPEGVRSMLNLFSLGRSIVEAAREEDTIGRASALNCTGDLTALMGENFVGEYIQQPPDGAATPPLWSLFQGAMLSHSPIVQCSGATALMKALMVGALTPHSAGLGWDQVLSSSQAPAPVPPLGSLFSLFSMLQWQLAAGKLPPRSIPIVTSLSLSLATFFPVYAALSDDHKRFTLGAVIGSLHTAMGRIPREQGGGFPLYFPSGEAEQDVMEAVLKPPSVSSPMGKKGEENDLTEDAGFIRKPNKRVGKRVPVNHTIPAKESAASTPLEAYKVLDLEPPCAWLTFVLDTVLAIAATTPVGTCGVQSIPVSPLFSSAWWTSRPASSAHFLVLAVSLAADLVADGYNGATFAPALVKALGTVLSEAVVCKEVFQDEQWLSVMGLTLEAATSAIDSKCSSIVERALAKIAIDFPPPCKGAKEAEKAFSALVTQRSLAMAVGQGAGGGVSSRSGRASAATKAMPASSTLAQLSENSNGPSGEAKVAAKRVSLGIGPGGGGRGRARGGRV